MVGLVGRKKTIESSTASSFPERPTVSTISVTHSNSNTATMDTNDALGLQRVDSQVSELTSPGDAGLVLRAADPPAAMMRSTSIETGDRQSSGQASGGENAGGIRSGSQSSPQKYFKDPPAITTMDSSIVTKVLGIVDLSCGGQDMMAAAATRDIRQVLSFQNEWGLKPDLDDDEPVNVMEYQFQQKIKQQALQQQQRQQSTTLSTNELPPSATMTETNASPSSTTPEEPVAIGAGKDSPNRGKRHENFELIYKEPEEEKTPPRKSVVGKLVKKLTIKRGSSSSKKVDSAPLGIASRDRAGSGDKGELENNPNFAGTLAIMGVPSSIDAGPEDAKKGIFRRGSKKKEQESSPNESAEATANATNTNKQRYKKVLKSIKTPSKMPLEAITEEAEGEESGMGGEIFVRVPGIQSADGFLSDKDLIGDEIVEEIYTELDKSLEEEAQQLQPVKETIATDQVPPTPTKDTSGPSTVTPSSSRSKSTAATTPDTVHDEEYNNGSCSNNNLGTPDLHRNRTWVERLGLKKAGSKEQSDKHHETARTPATSDDSAASGNSASNPVVAAPKVAPKPMWKAVVDQNTGKTYYYHRKTRETTWQMPPADEIVIPAQQTYQQQQRSDELIVKEAELQAILKDDFESEDVWEKKKEIARMLTTIAPPNGSSVERLVTQYKGKEDELLWQLRDLKESKPFDEPMTGPSERVDNQHFSLADENPLIRTRTAASIYSGFSSSKSRLSEKTEQIRNTGSRLGRRVNSSMVSTVSSRQSEQAISVPSSPARIPKNIPVPRLRELNVEEFSTSDRIYRARRNKPRNLHGGQNINNKASSRIDSTNISAAQHKSRHDSVEMNYLGDNDDTDKDAMSYATDSVSALSEADLSTLTDRRESAIGDARIRALDRAIAQEDWDLAAQISEGIRGNIGYKGISLRRDLPRGVAQSDLDRFIAQSDWDSVAAYIAYHRAKAVETERAKMSTHLGKAPPAASRALPPQARAYQTVQTTRSNVSETSRNTPEKRFGAKSQLQHQHLDTSGESFSSGYNTNDSEYTSESSYTDDDNLRRAVSSSRRHTKEFAC